MSIVRFENLPNEIFLEFFRYFSFEKLFSQFFGLNRRFDQLIHSISDLTYISQTKNELDQSLFPFIRRCVVLHPFDDEFWSNLSPHVRHLHLDYVTTDFFRFNFPQLESLVVDRRVHPLYIDEIRRRIFSDFYPRLSRCSISRISRSTFDTISINSTSIRIVHLNQIDGQTFLELLHVCPNLFELKIEVRQSTNFNVENSFQHEKLRRFRLDLFVDDDNNEKMFEKFLIVLPQLESFRVNRSCSIDRIQRSIEFFSKFFQRSQPVLCQFVFNVKLIRSKMPNETFQRENLFYLWKKSFCRNEHFRLNIF